MYKIIRSILLVSTLISFSSCLTSLHQLVTYDKAIMDDRITGNWQKNDKSIFSIEGVLTSAFFKSINNATVGNQEKYMGFDNKEDSMLYSKSYILSYSKHGYTFYMVASLMRLNKELYADISPIASQTDNLEKSKKTDDLFNNMPYMPSHTIAKIIFNSSSLEIKFLDGDFIKSQLTKGMMAVKYEIDPLFNIALITASPAELQQFINKYGNDERLYSNENTITLTKI